LKSVADERLRFSGGVLSARPMIGTPGKGGGRRRESPVDLEENRGAVRPLQSGNRERSGWFMVGGKFRGNAGMGASESVNPRRAFLARKIFRATFWAAAASLSRRRANIFAPSVSHEQHEDVRGAPRIDVRCKKVPSLSRANAGGERLGERSEDRHFALARMRDPHARPGARQIPARGSAAHGVWHAAAWREPRHHRGQHARPTAAARKTPSSRRAARLGLAPDTRNWRGGGSWCEKTRTASPNGNPFFVPPSEREGNRRPPSQVIAPRGAGTETRDSIGEGAPPSMCVASPSSRRGRGMSAPDFRLPE